jgi:hypothetical protein
MFMIYLHTNIHMPKLHDSLDITTKPKDKCRLRTAAILLFYINIYIYMYIYILIKFAYLCEDLLPHSSAADI